MVEHSRRATLVLGVVLCLVLVTGLAAAATSATLELQAAQSGESDSATLSYTFTAQANGTASVSPISDSQDGGYVVFDLVSSSSFTVEKGQTYTVEYEVTAQDGADEGTYSLNTQVNGPGDTYYQTLYADVEVREPAFGSVGSQDTEVVFTGQQTETNSLSVGFENVGDGVMTEISGSATNVPSGMSVNLQTPDELSAGESGTVDVEVAVDESVSEGTHQFTVELTDSLGNVESFPVSVNVVKPPIVAPVDPSLDLGNVMVGQSATEQFTIREINGYDDVNSLEVSTTSSDPSGTLSLPGVSGSYISAGGSTEEEVTISVDENAEQHETLNWAVRFTPSDSAGQGSTMRFEARVIYPPYYQSVSAIDRTITFDEPRSQRSEFTTSVQVSVVNGGDRPMQITGVTPEVSSPSVSARLESSTPIRVPAQSSETIDVTVSADTDTPEGVQALEVNLDSEVAGERTPTSRISIEHETELAVEDTELSYGQVVATQTVTRSTDIGERLGYQDVRDLEIERVSGPDQGWLTVTEQPAELNAGESAPFVTSLTFDTRANFFTEYTWTYRIDGDNVEPREVTIRATPRPVDFTSTVDVLRSWEGNSTDRRQAAARGMADSMEALASKLRTSNSAAAKRDVTTVSSAGRSTILFLSASARADEQMAADNRSAAQRSLTRAAAAYNTIQDSVSRIESPEVRRQVEATTTATNQIITDLLERQRESYRQRLESDDTTTLERAQISRQLSQLAALAGEDQRAASLENRSQEAFETYAQLVSNGNSNLQEAREKRGNLTAAALLSVGGQRVYWIGSIDSIGDQRQTVSDLYTKAGEQFESAGATSLAETARSEREQFEQAMEQARLFTLGLGGVLGIGFLILLGLEARALYRYVQESAAAVNGDFLLPHEMR